MTNRKKLIEVALPLEAINEASAREKSIRHGHPSTLHLWWARRPLAACRAVIFTSLVDDPDDPEAPPEFVAACRRLPAGKNAALNDTPRQRLFDFIELLVQWESTTNQAVLETARELIRLSTGGNPPPLLDPFAGGGSIPLEAQRLGLEAHASDLNPVAVMICKALIEIPPKFANRPPVNPRDRAGTGGSATWAGAAGLAADVRYYGEWMRDRARERIGHLYPPYVIASAREGAKQSPPSGAGTVSSAREGAKQSPPSGAETASGATSPRTDSGETVIAWLWARTVRCPNPACGAQMPLVRSFDLSTKSGRRAWVEPVVDPSTRRIAFVVKQGKGKGRDGTVNRRGATCIACGTPVPFEHVRAEGKAGRMGAQLMAIVTEGQSGRSYYAPTPEHEQAAQVPVPDGAPDTDLPEQALGFRVQLYGMTKHRDLFTPRQLVALTTFSDLVAEARAQVHADALNAGLPDDDIPLRDGGAGARAYAEAVSVYLAMTVSRQANRLSSMCFWDTSGAKVQQVFARQAIPMNWDFTEANPFSSSSGNFLGQLEYPAKVIDISVTAPEGRAWQHDATQPFAGLAAHVFATDPPYYDNIGYADLSDYFYVWLRPSVRDVYPEVFGTLLVPKQPELIASPHRHAGDSKKAVEHFEAGFVDAFTSFRSVTHRDYPLTLFYAFKQAESGVLYGSLAEGVSSTGWETMLEGLMRSGFEITGTWPIRTEFTRGLKLGVNALASSIVLVCRPRTDDSPKTSRREFVDALHQELPAALREMQSGNIAPVDLAQASIGPGMAVYSRYSQVLEPDGRPLSVRTALQLINQVLDDYLTEQEGYVDEDSRFAVAWFEQYGFKAGEFGVADVLARAKNTSVDGLDQAGILTSGAGKVRLYHWSELDPGWDPSQDRRLTAWEATHHLIERLNTHGEEGAARLLARLPADLAAEARQLAYRLYSICERKGWADHARDYNALVVSWGASQEQARGFREEYQQARLL